MRSSEMWEENLAKEINLPTSKFRGFSKIIESIYMTIDVFNTEVTLDINLKHPELLYLLSYERRIFQTRSQRELFP